MAEPKLPLTIAIKPSRKDQRKRQLEQGLLVILDTRPYSAHRTELVDVVNLAVAGMTIPKIARKLGISRRAVDRLLAEVAKAAKTRAAPLKRAVLKNFKPCRIMELSHILAWFWKRGQV
jgi:FixJ family two-component response regulator